MSLCVQAPAERRQVFRNELQRVGAAGAKVLRELGIKVQKMEKLGQVDILYEVHEAAEELQNKVDRKSYLLVNSESWEIGSRPGEPQESLNLDVDEDKYLEYKSLSEAVLDLRSVRVPKGWDDKIPAGNNGFNPEGLGSLPSNMNSTQPPGVPSDNLFRKNISWHAGLTCTPNGEPITEESKTYENASALALATFTSLLIEFVARLQHLVDSFHELSEKAKFKEPVESPETTESTGFWTRLFNCLKFWI